MSGEKSRATPTLVGAWERTLRRHGDERAVVQAADGRVCTFRELDDCAAAWLAAQRIEPAALAGRLVVFGVPNGIAWLEIFLGLQRAGAIAVPLDPGEPVPAQRRLAEELRAALWWNGEKLLSVAAPANHGRNRQADLRRREICLVKLTSGTTSRPRPLFFTGAQMLADARNVTRTMGIRVSDLNYALIPFGHSYGLGNLTLPLLAHGVPLVCGSAPLPHAIAEEFVRWKPTVFPSVPAVWRALASADFPPERFASLRLAISAGAPLAPEIARDFSVRFGRRIHAFYGSSETGGIAYDRTGAATLGGAVGRALQGVKITAVRGQRLRVCSAAVFTRGNSQRSAGQGCWSPPDRATIDARAQITLLGRQGTTVKIAGRRVNLAEVAGRLRRLRGVHDAWVAVSGANEVVLGAAVVSERAARDLRAELHTDTAAWKIPKRWATLREFPLTARGKIDSRALHASVFGPSPQPVSRSV